MDLQRLDQRPVVIAIAGPNGAGKTTFYHVHLQPAALPFVNADVLALELDLEPYAAARLAGQLRAEFIRRRESFVFETVFSDPVGEKLALLQHAAAEGYTAVLCFIGISGPDISEQRVAMRTSQGGHDVPNEKLQARFPRILANLKAAIRQLPYVVIYDNDNMNRPYRHAATCEAGKLTFASEPLPAWLVPLAPA